MENERIEKRAKSIVAMGLVKRVGENFEVFTLSLRGRQTTYTVKRNEQGKTVCNCLYFKDEISRNKSFRCEHILAVGFAFPEDAKLENIYRT